MGVPYTILSTCCVYMYLSVCLYRVCVCACVCVCSMCVYYIQLYISITKAHKLATGDVESVLTWRLVPAGGEGGQAETVGSQERQQWRP